MDFDYLEDLREQEPESRQDPYVDECARHLLAFFREHKDRVFYMKQLEVIWEKKYYHWITARALGVLDGGEIKSITKKVREGIEPKFFFHRRNRYYKRAVDKAARIIRRYSEPRSAGPSGLTRKTSSSSRSSSEVHSTRAETPENMAARNGRTQNMTWTS